MSGHEIQPAVLRGHDPALAVEVLILQAVVSVLTLAAAYWIERDPVIREYQRRLDGANR